MSKTRFTKAVPFVNRHVEQEYLLDYIAAAPQHLLRLYGPKSTGKTTLISQVAKNLSDDYLVINVNFRRYMIGDYRTFVHAMFKESEKVKNDLKSMARKTIEFFQEKYNEYDRTSLMDFGFAKVSTTIKKRLDDKLEDPFMLYAQLLKEINAQGKHPVLVFDEIQQLKGLYYNGDALKKELLAEFFAFLISITKELHLASVICLTSESTFMEEIYNHAKLKNTSDFHFIDHFDKNTTYRRLEEEEGLERSQASLFWKYLGGSPQEIWIALVKYQNLEKKSNEALGKILLERVEQEYVRIRDYVVLNDKQVFTSQEQNEFLELIRIISKKGYAIRGKDAKTTFTLISKLVEKDIIFYDVLHSKLTANSESCRQAFKKML